MGNCQNCENRMDFSCAACHAYRFEKRICSCYKCDYSLCVTCAPKYDACICTDCHRFSCSLHKLRCPFCTSLLCQDCAAKSHTSRHVCSSCREAYCNGRVNVCLVCRRWICVNCYKTCYACKDWYCQPCLTRCGQRGCYEKCCDSHKNVCKECQKVYCGAHYCKQEGYCVNCYTKCHICMKRDPNSKVCANCKQVACAQCCGQCKVCPNKWYCAKCMYYCEVKDCVERSCVTHRANCRKCGRMFCLNHCSNGGFCVSCAPVCHIF